MKSLSPYFAVLLFVLMAACAPTKPTQWAKKSAPEVFTAEFETTKGTFVIESRREWSPAAVDRLYVLIKSGYYEDIAFFRVIPDFVAQFGISNDSMLYANWNHIPVPDEAVRQSNVRGTIAFARDTAQTRTSQLYINLKDNVRLDTISFYDVTGFPVIAKVTSGMDVVDALYKGYGAEIQDKQDSIAQFGNAFLREGWPKLDYIKEARIKE